MSAAVGVERGLHNLFGRRPSMQIKRYRSARPTPTIRAEVPGGVPDERLGAASGGRRPQGVAPRGDRSASRPLPAALLYVPVVERAG